MLQTKGLAFRLGASPELVVAFGRQSILTLCLLLTVLEGGLLSAHSSAPGASKPKTMEAFATYVQATNARNDSELQNGRDLLWVDTLPQPGRDQAYKSLAQGELQIEQRTTREHGRAIPCPEGMIHHWEGLVFIPGVHVDDVLRILEDYDRHSSYYAPDVVESKLESQSR